MYNRKFTPNNISELKDNEIFVFGSNLQGSHGGGAARAAHELFGAIWGKGVGLQGHSYAIPTMHGGTKDIKPYVDEFIEYASQHPEQTFLVTRIGCGIAGFRVKDMAPLFAKAIDMENVILPKDFVLVIEKHDGSANDQAKQNPGKPANGTSQKREAFENHAKLYGPPTVSNEDIKPAEKPNPKRKGDNAPLSNKERYEVPATVYGPPQPFFKPEEKPNPERKGDNAPLSNKERYEVPATVYGPPQPLPIRNRMWAWVLIAVLVVVIATILLMIL